LPDPAITFEPETTASHPNLRRLDFSLVSNETLSKILPSSGLDPGLDEMGQKGLKRLHL